MKNSLLVFSIFTAIAMQSALLAPAFAKECIEPPGDPLLRELKGYEIRLKEAFWTLDVRDFENKNLAEAESSNNFKMAIVGTTKARLKDNLKFTIAGEQHIVSGLTYASVIDLKHSKVTGLGLAIVTPTKKFGAQNALRLQDLKNNFAGVKVCAPDTVLGSRKKNGIPDSAVATDVKARKSVPAKEHGGDKPSSGDSATRID